MTRQPGPRDPRSARRWRGRRGRSEGGLGSRVREVDGPGSLIAFHEQDVRVVDARVEAPVDLEPQFARHLLGVDGVRELPRLEVPDLDVALGLVGAHDEATVDRDFIGAELVGDAGIMRWLELKESAVLDLAKEGQILAVTTLQGDVLFPAVQFGPDGSLLPRLGEVLKALRGTIEDWSIALWMLYEDPAVGTNAFERLRSGDAEGVIRDATRQSETPRSGST